MLPCLIPGRNFWISLLTKKTQVNSTFGIQRCFCLGIMSLLLALIFLSFFIFLLGFGFAEKAKVSEWMAHANAIFDLCWIKVLYISLHSNYALVSKRQWFFVFIISKMLHMLNSCINDIQVNVVIFGNPILLIWRHGTWILIIISKIDHL